jgi:AcrR family transcriptional regulator
MMASSTQARQDAGDVGRGPGKDPAAGQRRPGRPRNAAYDKSILGAALEMLVEKGYAGLTIDGVAVRAGVGRPTIYRRWPSKAALAIAALEEAVPQAVTPDSSSGSLRDDLRAFQRDRVARMNLAVTRPVIAGLVSDSAADPALADAFRAWYQRHQEAVVAALQRAIDRGELPPGADFELINDLLLGPLFTRSVVRGEHLEPRHADATVEVVLAAFCAGTRP